MTGFTKGLIASVRDYGKHLTQRVSRIRPAKTFALGMAICLVFGFAAEAVARSRTATPILIEHPDTGMRMHDDITPQIEQIEAIPVTIKWNMEEYREKLPEGCKNPYGPVKKRPVGDPFFHHEGKATVVFCQIERTLSFEEELLMLETAKRSNGTMRIPNLVRLRDGHLATIYRDREPNTKDTALSQGFEIKGGFWDKKHITSGNVVPLHDVKNQTATVMGEDKSGYEKVLDGVNALSNAALTGFIGYDVVNQPKYYGSGSSGTGEVSVKNVIDIANDLTQTQGGGQKGGCHKKDGRPGNGHFSKPAPTPYKPACKPQTAHNGGGSSGSHGGRGGFKSAGCLKF